MDDVAVLLNLTGKLVLEKANPLIDLVSGHGPLLFYDQLSLERFPLDEGEQERHVLRLLVGLRNLLGSRRLSANDQGGGIRIIVTMDLVGGFGCQQGTAVCFPSQRVRRFCEMMNRVFEKDTQLYSRLQLNFIFMEWDSDDRRLANFYSSLAYEGCMGPDDWVSATMLTANKARDEMHARLKPSSPDADLSLDDGSIRAAYSDFQKKLKAQQDRVSALMERAGAGEAFKKDISEAMEGVKTYGELRNFDFDGQFKAVVSELLGLCASEFEGYHFFIFKMRTGTIAHRKKDEMVFHSLLQLLATMSPPWKDRFAVVDGSMNEHALNAEAMALLRSEVSSYLSKLKDGGELRWMPNDEVEYLIYSEINSKATEASVHYEHNEEVDKERMKLNNEFANLRRIPFFFGRNPNDWKWFTGVCGILDEIQAYETEHDRPRYVPTGRITEKEMKSVPAKTSYADLEETRKKLEAHNTNRKQEQQAPKIGNLLTDLKTYLEEREKEMGNFIKYKEELKKEMVKLGFASITLRLAVVACLIITLCYALHFVYTGNYAESIWVGACVVAVALACGVAALASRSRIKSAITDLFVRIDGCLSQMDKLKQQYLNNINNRVSLQNEADIRRKNLEEINGKLERFKCHNMQVELWEKHFASLENNLKDMLLYTGNAETAQQKTQNKTDADSLQLEATPRIPESVYRKFNSMTVSLSQQGWDCKDITCFLNSLHVTVNNK